MEWSRLLSLVSAVFLLVGPILLSAAQTPADTANSQASASTRFQPEPVERPLTAEAAAPSMLLAESVDCSRILGGLNKLYLPMIMTKGSTGTRAAEAGSLVATQTFGPVANVGADFATANAFLYLGSAAVQHGLQSQTIDPLRAAVLRGRVCTRAGTPLAGVEITVLNHPEYGNTLSRADGMFDLAVNGGGLLTLNYARAGYLPAQRQVISAPRDYAWLAEVVLIPRDSQVTHINLAEANMQVVRGSAVADSDGARQATLLVPQGTTAELVMPDGSTLPITNLSVRATEYTVGNSGPNAMPAQLPPSSGYTYALEYSVDQAQATGAVEVRFNQPLMHYVENFLEFPVGMLVPTGYYDRRKGAWFPSENGRVVKIVSISGGLAGLDTDGDGAADNNAALGIPQDVASGPDGSLYIADQGNHRIRRVAPDGSIITTVAGNGLRGYSGDGGPATQASLSSSEGLAVGPDGSLYLGDHQNYRVRWVGPDGIISTVAGNGRYGYSGDSGPATRASLNETLGVALGPDGQL